MPKLFLYLLSMVLAQSLAAQDTVRTYYPSGKPQRLQVQIDKTTVYEKGFFENGQLKTEGYAVFKNGKYRPLNLRSFFENGQPEMIAGDTSFTMYEPNGNIYFHQQLKNSIPNGWRVVYLNGNLWGRQYFIDDMKWGKAYFYDDRSGRVISEDNYVRNKKEGLSINYDTTGHIQTTTFYKAGIPTKVVYYNSKGKIIKTTNGKTEAQRDRMIKSFLNH